MQPNGSDTAQSSWSSHSMNDSTGVPGLTSKLWISRSILSPASGELSPGPDDRVVELGHHSFLQGNDGIVGNVDVFGAHVGAALGDVAEAQPGLRFDQLESIVGVQGVHLQRRQAH